MKKIESIVFSLVLMLLFTLVGCTAKETTEISETSTQETLNELSSALVEEESTEVEVWVVDQCVEGTNEANRSVSSYVYDESGKLTEIYVEGAANSSGDIDSLFEYDESGNILSVSDYSEYVGWEQTYLTTYGYSDDSICTSFRGEVVSQCSGAVEFSYTYDDSELLIASVMTQYTHGSSNAGQAANLSYSYLENGHPSKLISDTANTRGFGLVEELSDSNSGLYVYRDTWDALTTLRFNEDNNLTSVETRSSNSSNLTTYTYKKITVDKDSYKPTIYSNPAGFLNQYFPQLTKGRITQILTETQD